MIAQPETVPSLRDAFLINRERYADVMGDHLGDVPPVELQRKRGFGEIIAPLDDATREAADRLVDGGSVAAHPSLPLLAGAYRDTGDERYAEAARAYYRQWLAGHPADGDWTRARQAPDFLMHGLYHWLGPLHLFLSGPVFEDDTLAAIIDSARIQLDCLAGLLWPDRNLRITCAASLFNNGLRLAFLPEAERWLRIGARAMSDACLRQIEPDGSHMEATPHYHYCTMGDVLNVFRKARLRPELGLNMPPPRVAAMYDYLAAATHPTGWVTGINDGTYGRSDVVHGNGIADILDERARFRRSVGLPEAPLPDVQLYPDAGQVFLRDGWTRDATYLTFDAAPCRSWHWHPGRNGVQLQAHGRMLLVDPGRFSYSDPQWGGCALRTDAHNTLNLNGWNQAPGGGGAIRLRRAPGYEIVEGLHTGGYWTGRRDAGLGEGIYAEHHRILLWIRDRCAIVIDTLYCPAPENRKPSLESVWQLSEGPVTLDFGRRRAFTGHADANLLMLFPLAPEGINARIIDGATEPRRGWLPRTFEKEFVPAPLISLRIDRCDPWFTDLATVLIPYRGTAMPEVEVLRTIDPGTADAFQHPGRGRLALRWPDGSTDEIWWRRRLELALNDGDGFVTDGSLAHLRRNPGGELETVLVVDGTFFEPRTRKPRSEPQTFVC